MIKLTEVQHQTAVALATLTRDTPKKALFTAEEVRDKRLAASNKQEKNKMYLRTTQNALRQLNQIVPQLVVDNAIGWKLTKIGHVMARSQLNIAVRYPGAPEED